MAYTLSDFVKLNPMYKKRYDPTSNTAYLSNANTGKEISFQSGQGQQYGLGALQNDSQMIEDPQKLYSALNQPQAYTSPYQPQINQLVTSLSNRPSFSYSPESDKPLQYAQDEAIGAVSRAAARRGMLFSESNKSQMGKAALALVPQYEEAAYNRYAQDQNAMYNQLSALSGLENQGYNRYRDTVGDQRYLDESQISTQDAELDRQLKQAELDIYDPALSRQENQLKIEQLKAQIGATNRSNRPSSPDAPKPVTVDYNKVLAAAMKDERWVDPSVSRQSLIQEYQNYLYPSLRPQSNANIGATSLIAGATTDTTQAEIFSAMQQGVSKDQIIARLISMGKNPKNYGL